MKDKHIKAYMKTALVFAECSNATRLKVGAVLVRDNNILSCGYNALPRHIYGPCELPDGTTDPRVRHAEKNALMALTRRNESSKDATLFVTHSCCVYCAVDIVDAGVKEVFYLYEYRDTSGIDYLRQSGVTVTKLDL